MKAEIGIIGGSGFSTKAESKFYSQDVDIINMTQYPEAALARELEMCYVNISLVTDYDAGLKNRKDVKPVTTAEVLKIFQQNNKKVRGLILAIIKNLPRRSACLCQKAMEKAEV